MKYLLSPAVQPVHTARNSAVNFHLFLVAHSALPVMVPKGYGKGDAPGHNRLQYAPYCFFCLPGLLPECTAVALQLITGEYHQIRPGRIKRSSDKRHGILRRLRQFLYICKL